MRSMRRIKRYPKPYVALINGLVMGGGVGVSLAAWLASRRDRKGGVLAMPEVGIGFFPDVGATWARCRGFPHHIGAAMLPCTGLRAKGADMAALGLATDFVESGRLSPGSPRRWKRPAGRYGGDHRRIRWFRRRLRGCLAHAVRRWSASLPAAADVAGVEAALSRRPRLPNSHAFADRP